MVVCVCMEVCVDAWLCACECRARSNHQVPRDDRCTPSHARCTAHGAPLDPDLGRWQANDGRSGTITKNGGTVNGQGAYSQPTAYGQGAYSQPTPPAPNYGQGAYGQGAYGQNAQQAAWDAYYHAQGQQGQPQYGQQYPGWQN